MLSAVFIILLGLIVGSFLNVLICRLPQGKSLVKPGSACPACGHRLGFLDLFPVASFLALRAKCRYCGARISWQYPAVEALTGLAFFLLWLRTGLSVDLIFLAIFAALLIAIALIDLHEMLIPDVLSLPGIAVGLLGGLVNGRIISSLLGAVVGAGILLAVYYAVLFLLKKEGLGLGDAKLLSMIGAFLGWQAAVFSIFVASLLGSIFGVIMMATGRLKRGEPMPFGPYLAGAGLILAIWPWTLWLGPLLGFH